ncbi:MAG: hypothetical protein KDG44_16205, partial [Burkholderiaceae bacterium]|nr:hypothetical protein [Burkholderiaceae bacterium]
ALEAAGYDPVVVVAYQTVAPLLAENEAISAFVTSQGSLMLRSLLPEVTTVQEALRIAQADRPMSKKQTLQLSKMLHKLPRG